MSNTNIAVIKEQSIKTELTLVATGTLKSRLGKMSKDSIATTLSLAYYTAINGNVAPMSTSLQNITSLLHPVYRQFICAKFNKESQVWEYNKPKAMTLLKTLGLTYNSCSFDTFVAAIEELKVTKDAKAAKIEADKNALSPEETKDNCKDKVSKYLLKHIESGDLTALELKTIVASLSNAQAKKDSKSIELATAGK
tara:strand:- start:190 stop:777 length:588 start_codon:yes stop_codon:yes gene_type:complete